jgi:hypothetical protein
MRYYVYCESFEESIEPYIIAEVVRDVDDDRSLSLAAALAGPKSKIMTRTELTANLEGRRALEAWDSRDDHSFEAETALLQRPGRIATNRLHVVRDGDRETRRHGLRMPSDPRMREAILMSRGLREMTRVVVQRARALRSELRDGIARHSTTEEHVG